MIRIGVDTGGTFTDFVLRDDDRVAVHKVRSTPDDPSRAILQGLAELGMPLTGADVVHGSTVATNAVLERRGAKVALVATAGFEDVLRIGRQTRRELYNVFVADRRPFVDADLVVGIRERVGPTVQCSSHSTTWRSRRWARGCARAAPRPSPSVSCTRTSTPRTSER